MTGPGDIHREEISVVPVITDATSHYAPPYSDLSRFRAAALHKSHSAVLRKHNDSTIETIFNPLLGSYPHNSASLNLIMSQHNIPHSNTIPYVNDQNVLPRPIDPSSAKAKRLRRAERGRKNIYSIVPRCSPPPEFLSNDAFRILPKGWWKCTYAGCPVGAHDLGERLCPTFASKGKYLPDGRKEAERDPIDLQEGWWCCPNEKCELRSRRPLYEERRICKCENNYGRDALIEEREKIFPTYSSADNVERWVAQLPALPTEEEIDIMEGGLEPGLEYAYEIEQPTSSKPQKLLSLRLPRRLGTWELSLRDKPSGSK
ncbi:uncharacterized protein Bfra_007369 [Botrytis fragariae]|uniref:Uncharacterized protein n=1 Tax=Botrytis fragariae TaxID=1964551 RepID=A0A8H6EDJ4_9HELO|nr:uncharacterized protein Bfra_007369 [Botrytis fragariae]KAF5868173.1 hypothetical protein Bfra_007369 [Botrytis fragariae]